SAQALAKKGTPARQLVTASLETARLKRRVAGSLGKRDDLRPSMVCLPARESAKAMGPCRFYRPVGICSLICDCWNLPRFGKYGLIRLLGRDGKAVGDELTRSDA